MIHHDPDYTLSIRSSQYLSDYRFESYLRVAAETHLLMVVGTAGATTLPNHIVNTVYHNGGTIIDSNIQKNVFSEVALAGRMGMFIESTAAQGLTDMVELMQTLDID